MVCGGAFCGGGKKALRELASSIQDDDADLWNDLTFQTSIPEPKAPPVPRVVQFPTCHDDVSALCGPNFYDEEKCDDDDEEEETMDLVELRLGRSTDRFDNNDSYKIFEGTKSSALPPLRPLPPLKEDCDGSSYSSYKKSTKRKKRHPWQNDLPDKTMQTQNQSVRIFLTVQ